MKIFRFCISFTLKSKSWHINMKSSRIRYWYNSSSWRFNLINSKITLRNHENI